MKKAVSHSLAKGGEAYVAFARCALDDAGYLDHCDRGYLLHKIVLTAQVASLRSTKLVTVSGLAA